MKQKLFTFFLTLIASVNAIYASDTQVDGIWYNFDNSTKTASVTYRGGISTSYDDEYSGSVIIPKTVTYNSTTYNVTSIGGYAFSGCSSLTSITIPNSVTSIGDYAFRNCTSLTSITIPNSVTSIIDHAFSGCSSLPVENNLRYADTYIVEAVDKTLSTYYIKAGTKWIGSDAFSGCFSLTSIAIPNSVTSIGEEAFSWCSSLTSVTIPNSVTSIEYMAFSGCSSLTSLTIPNSVTSIGSNAFSGCSSLTSIAIPNSVTSIEYMAFYSCSSLTSITIPNSVTSIGGEAFRNCTSLTSITIPNSVTSIGEWAFRGCSSLTSITIPNSVLSIGNSAFYGCSSLTSMVVENGNTTYDSRENCNAIIETETNTLIAGCQNTIIPNSVMGIGDYAFYSCSSLTSITIPNSVTSIGGEAFRNCTSLTSITIPNSVTSIEWYAFSGCSSLTSVTIGNSVTSIGDYAFRNCSSLASVTIGNSVTSIREEAFSGCSSLTSVTINSNAIVSKDYSYDDNISDIFGSQVTEYIIGNKVKDIGPYAFYGCSSLTSVTIPNSVTYIGDEAFYGCYSLTSVTCEAETPPTLGSYIFDGVSKSIPVYVPCGCVEAYKTANGWKNFINIQEPLAEYSIEVNVNDNIMGSAKVDYNTFCEGSQISATPNIGYHFVQWSDGNTNNPRSLELTQDTILTAEFAQSRSGQCGDSLYWELIETTLHITGSGEMYNYTSDTVPWKLLVSSINSLTIAEDVTSIERSAFSGCSAIESIVWSAKNFADPADKEVAPFYDIRSQINSFTFGEAVEHIPAYLCYGMDKLTSVTTPNSLKTIGTSAFEGCARLGKISLGTGLEEIAANAFAGCTRLYDIYVYAAYPPFADESSFANYNVYVYIPCEYQRDYTLDVVWGKFKFIECIDSEEATTDGNVTILPGYNDVTITWPTEDNADNYAIVIEKDGEVFCTLTFNADGQLLNIAFAPARNGDNRPVQYAEQAVSGYRFTVTGLTEATRYAYNVTTKDAANKTIATYSGEFTTKGGITTAVEDILHSTTNCQKLLRDGQLIIIRDGKTYNVMGKAL